VNFLASRVRAIVQSVLEEIHVQFSTTDEGELDLTQRGRSVLEHHPRGRATGRAIENCCESLRSEPNIES